MHFICPPHALWPELVNPERLPLPPDVMALRAGSSISAWVIQVYHWFKARGEAVSISGTTRPEAINIAHIRSFGRKLRLSQAYVLVARADGHVPQLANFTLHQNNQFVPGPRTAGVPHWPQPGLTPRDRARGTKLTRLSYMGTAGNLADDFKSDAFRVALAEMGITLNLRFSQGGRDCSDWSDYAQTDAVIAVRGRAAYLETLKPASKLVNAWSAGVPALLGAEPAFQELRESPLDYFETPTAEDALAALQKLKGDPDLYNAMIAHGAERAEAFTEDRVGMRWMALLNGPVAEDFARWQRRSWVRKWAFVVASLLSEGRAQKRHAVQMQDAMR